jgi:hypothetical protein
MNQRYLPHYMQLRQQDMDNKYSAKAKIKKIKLDKPKLITTPHNKKWKPVKIAPVNAALNARFFKGKQKPEIQRKGQDKSMARLRKFKHNSSNEEFDRSESHCRRCEACRNRRAAFHSHIMRTNINIKVTPSHAKRNYS